MGNGTRGQRAFAVQARLNTATKSLDAHIAFEWVLNMLRVRLFGAFELEEGQPAYAPLGANARHLASYLFSFPNEKHRREKLLDMFWCDSDVDRARAALSTALWRIRRLTSQGEARTLALRATPHDVCLELADTSVVDVHRFRNETLNSFSSDKKTVNVEALSDAAGLYKAPFLEEYDEDWVLDLRERLQSLYLRSLTYLMRWQAHQKRYDDALLYGQRILSSDPTRETIQRSMMLLYVLNGQRAEAIRQFKRCEVTLRSECDVEPMPETSSLYQLIRSGDVFQKLPQLAEKEFVPAPNLPPPSGLWH